MSVDSCDTHGWWEVDGQDECPVCVIVRLQDELKIAKSGYNYMENQRLRAEVERLEKDMEGWPAAFTIRLQEQTASLERERDEALAQVRALLDRLQQLENEVATLRQAVGLATTIKPSLVMRPNNPIGMVEEIVAYVKRAEAAVEALSRLVWRHDHLAQQRGDLSEQEWRTARTALAAWEEGKA